MPRPLANRDDRQHPAHQPIPPTSVDEAAPDTGPYSEIAALRARKNSRRFTLNGTLHSFRELHSIRKVRFKNDKQPGRIYHESHME